MEIFIKDEWVCLDEEIFRGLYHTHECSQKYPCYPSLLWDLSGKVEIRFPVPLTCYKIRGSDTLPLKYSMYGIVRSFAQRYEIAKHKGDDVSNIDPVYMFRLLDVATYSIHSWTTTLFLEHIDSYGIEILGKNGWRYLDKTMHIHLCDFRFDDRGQMFIGGRGEQYEIRCFKPRLPYDSKTFKDVLWIFEKNKESGVICDMSEINLHHIAKVLYLCRVTRRL
jgi:hypothetical protein